MSQYDEAIRMLAADLGVGSSTKVHCPRCKGGDKREVSFSLTRTPERLAYICHRASCPGLRGYIGEPPTEAQLLLGNPKSIVNPYTGSTWSLTDYDNRYFLDRFLILPSTLEEHGVQVSEKDEYIFPILDPIGRRRGITLRQPRWTGLPKPPREGISSKRKALIYPDRDEPMQSFYGPPNGSHLLLVEDQLSAMRVAQDMDIPCVALCGVGANAPKVREWASRHADTLVIALDADATGTAFQIAKKWGLAFHNVLVKILEEDLKDSDDVSYALGLG